MELVSVERTVGGYHRDPNPLLAQSRSDGSE
jgi:hypothetical protein